MSNPPISMYSDRYSDVGPAFGLFWDEYDWHVLYTCTLQDSSFDPPDTSVACDLRITHHALNISVESTQISRESSLYSNPTFRVSELTRTVVNKTIEYLKVDKNVITIYLPDSQWLKVTFASDMMAIKDEFIKEFFAKTTAVQFQYDWLEKRLDPSKMEQCRRSFRLVSKEMPTFIVCTSVYEKFNDGQQYLAKHVTDSIVDSIVCDTRANVATLRSRMMDYGVRVSTDDRSSLMIMDLFEYFLQRNDFECMNEQLQMIPKSGGPIARAYRYMRFQPNGVFEAFFRSYPDNTALLDSFEMIN